jgi:hypothetical protein
VILKPGDRAVFRSLPRRKGGAADDTLPLSIGLVVSVGEDGFEIRLHGYSPHGGRFVPQKRKARPENVVRLASPREVATGVVVAT